MSRQVTALERRPDQQVTPFEPRGLEEAMHLAERLSRSSLIPQALRGKPDDVLVTLITGHELGLSPMQALRGIHVVQGRPVMSADLLVALVQRSAICDYFRLVESTDEIATYETRRRGYPDATAMSWTIEQAKKAGLLGKDNWRAHAAAMLRARCAAALARAVYPDLVLGVAEEDERHELEQRPVPAYSPPPSRVSPPPRPAPAPAPVLDVAPAPPAEPDEAPLGPPDETEQAIARYVESIGSAQTPDELRAVGQRLAAEAPEVRDAIRPVYAQAAEALRGTR